jgi:hypothetical protein
MSASPTKKAAVAEEKKGPQTLKDFEEEKQRKIEQMKEQTIVDQIAISKVYEATKIKQQKAALQKSRNSPFETPD